MWLICIAKGKQMFSDYIFLPFQKQYSRQDHGLSSALHLSLPQKAENVSDKRLHGHVQVVACPEARLLDDIIRCTLITCEVGITILLQLPQTESPGRPRVENLSVHCQLLWVHGRAVSIHAKAALRPECWCGKCVLFPSDTLTPMPG
jgi:hypothetical protein